LVPQRAGFPTKLDELMFLNKPDSGTRPSRWLKHRLRCFKLKRFPKLQGIMPSNWFLERSRVLRCFSSANFSRIWPFKSFLERFVRDRMLIWIKASAGIEPESLFPERSREKKFLQPASVLGMITERLCLKDQSPVLLPTL
jgi:hypothetical protein